MQWSDREVAFLFGEKWEIRKETNKGILMDQSREQVAANTRILKWGGGGGGGGQAGPCFDILACKKIKD